MSAPSKEITQSELNTVLQNLQEILTIKNPLTIEDTTNDYCNLSIEVATNHNIETGSEYIITEPFNIALSNPAFSIFDYFVMLKYYRLDPDLDESDVSMLLEKEVALTNGNNEITFDEYPIYLQEDFDLLIKKSD